MSSPKFFLGSFFSGHSLFSSLSLSFQPSFPTQEKKDSRRFLLLRLIIFPGVILIYAFPDPYRSLSYIVGFGMCIIYAFWSWPQVWMIILYLIPALEMAPPLFDYPKLLPHRFLLVFAAIILLIKWARTKHLYRIFPSPVFLAFGGFIGANVISALQAGSPDAFFRSLTYFEPLLYFTLTWALIFLYRWPPDKFIFNLILAGAWVQVIGLVEIITQKTFRQLLSISGPEALPVLMAENRFGLGGRIASTLSHPVYAGFYFLLLLILSLYFFYHFRRNLKGLLILLFPLTSFLILATGTRAIILCLVLSLATFYFLLSQQRKTFLPVVAGSLVLLIFFLVLFPQIPAYFQKSLKLRPRVQESVNLRYRLALTKALFQEFKEKPLFGHGPGLIQKQALQGKDSKYKGFSGIENQYAIILADGGILAGLAYLIFIVFTLVEAWKLDGRSPPELIYGRAALLATLAAYFFFVVSETCLTLAPNFILMSFYGSLIARKWRLQQPRTQEELG